MEEVSHQLGCEEFVDWAEQGRAAFLMGTHARAGAASIVRRLVSHGCAGLVQRIWSFVGPLQYAAPTRLTRGRPYWINGCCAVTGDGLYEGLDWLSNAMQGSQQLNDATMGKRFDDHFEKISWTRPRPNSP